MPIERYRKKPVVVKAIQWTYDNTEEVIQFCAGIGGETLFSITRYRYPFPRGKAAVFDRLHNSWIEVDELDWIIRGIEGEFYPCKPGIFETTHELVARMTEEMVADTPSEMDELRARLTVATSLYAGAHGQPAPMAIRVNGGRLLYGEVIVEREESSAMDGGLATETTWQVVVHTDVWPRFPERVTLRMGTVDQQDLEGKAYAVELRNAPDGWRSRFAGTGPLRLDEMAGR